MGLLRTSRLQKPCLNSGLFWLSTAFTLEFSKQTVGTASLRVSSSCSLPQELSQLEARRGPLLVLLARDPR